jgi:hypothetical protein
MNNVVHSLKNNLLKLVMAVLIAVAFALSGVGHAQKVQSASSATPVATSSGETTDSQKSGSGWGG